VYFYHYFEDVVRVSDTVLLDVVRATVDVEHPRQWYWALMDYGSFLKRNGAGRIDKSAHYKKQSPLQGSLREVRGQILRVLVGGDVTESDLRAELNADDRFVTALQDLIRDGMVENSGDYLHLTK
jgi:A/G-specific adenine glycosylase